MNKPERIALGFIIALQFALIAGLYAELGEVDDDTSQVAYDLEHAKHEIYRIDQEQDQTRENLINVEKESRHAINGVDQLSQQTKADLESLKSAIDRANILR